MTELERRLVILGRELDLPAGADLAPLVAARLAARAPSRRRRAFVVAVALLAVALGAAFAVPQARTAILHWLGIDGVSIERVPEQPTAPSPATANLGLGSPATLTSARRRVAYQVVVPAALCRPSEVWVSRTVPGGQVALVYFVKDAASSTVLFTQFRAGGIDLIRKAAGPGTTIEPVTVGGEPGYWLEGDPHAFLYQTPDGEVREDTFRLAGNVLVWLRGDLTLRLEGIETKASALGVAASVHSGEPGVPPRCTRDVD